MLDKRRQAEPLPPPPATFHFIGIGGIGMSGLARILAMWGHKVTGSDVAESAQVDALRRMDIPVVIGHNNPEFATLADIVVTNKRAVPHAGIELAAAETAGARVIKRGDLLGMVANEKTSICVAGSHGKSTTSGMLSSALRRLGSDPTFAVGAILSETGTNAEPGTGPIMVVEADEFDRSFWGLFPNVAIITSVAFDHPDIYDDQDEYDDAFVEFAANIKPDGTVVIAGDDDGCARVVRGVNALRRPDLHVQTFGEHEDADWRLDRDSEGWTVRDPEGASHRLEIGVPGRYNARNAVAALAALHAAGFGVPEAIAALRFYRGIGRRFERKGSLHGADIIDDYAHHPDEIAAVLSAAKETYPNRRVIAIHQPHTYSRTHALMKEFAGALDIADEVVLMEIYGVGEENEYGISSDDMAALMRTPVAVVSTPEDAAAQALALLDKEPRSVVFTLGAGTVTNVGPIMLHSRVPAPTRRSEPTRPPRVATEPPIHVDGLRIQPQAPMSLYTTMRIGGPAQYLVKVGSNDDLARAWGWAVEQRLPVTIIGGGSNLLVSDDGVNGLVIVARTPGARSGDLVEVNEDGDKVSLRASALVPSSWLGKFAADRGIAGLDWMVGLPGQLGGAIVNNAGAHGSEIQDFLVGVDTIDAEGMRETHGLYWLKPAYRMTEYKHEHRPRSRAILGAEFHLTRGEPAELQAMAASHAEFRRDTQPTGACSGSLFANPRPDYAAQLIERAGLKGFNVGQMQLSPKHANWMINLGGGTAGEAWELIQIAIHSVRDAFGVELRPEIEFIGRFEEGDTSA